jgi:hypothetical protein
VKFEPVVAVAVSEMFVGGGNGKRRRARHRASYAGWHEISLCHGPFHKLMPRDACVGLTNIR